MKRVYVSNGDPSVEEMFTKRGWIASKSLKFADLLCFTGGADISPFLYGERPLPRTSYSSNRDNTEIGLWKSVDPSFPKVGICRGAQLGNVLCGGSLWQHVDNHMIRHPVKDLSGIREAENRHAMLMVSSVHHQMCRPTKEAMILATSNRSMHKEAEGVSKTYGQMLTTRNEYEDVEAFYYDNFNFLGVQFHPEFQGVETCTKYFFDLIDFCFDFEEDDDRDTDKEVSDMPQGEIVI